MELNDQTMERKSLIQRCGTPIYDMVENELPSPVVKANASNVKLLPFAFPLHEKNGDEDDSIGPDNGDSGKGEKAINRQQKRQAGYPNYLKEF